MARNVLVFWIAAFLEIAGCFAFWTWLRRGASPAIAALGIVSLLGFAFALTRVDAAFAGRAYAAYGGIYIAASLAWLWLVEGQQPSASDLLGAGVAIIGALNHRCFRRSRVNQPAQLNRGDPPPRFHESSRERGTSWP